MNEVHGPRALSQLRTVLHGLLVDEAVTGHLLVVGVALAHHVTTTPGPWRLEDAAYGCFPGGRTSSYRRAREVLAGDVLRVEAGEPAGGALAAHFPGIDWVRVWTELDPWGVRPVDGVSPAGLRLHIDVHDDVDEPAQPALRLVR